MLSVISLKQNLRNPEYFKFLKGSLNAIGAEKESVSSQCPPSRQPPLESSLGRSFHMKALACPSMWNEGQPCEPTQHQCDQAQGCVDEVTQEVNGL